MVNEQLSVARQGWVASLQDKLLLVIKQGGTVGTSLDTSHRGATNLVNYQAEQR